MIIILTGLSSNIKKPLSIVKKFKHAKQRLLLADQSTGFICKLKPRKIKWS